MTSQNDATQIQEDRAQMQMLRSLLFSQELEDLSELKTIIHSPKRLDEKMTPIIEQHLIQLKKQFPKEFSTVLNRMIEQKLKTSQSELMDVIYPIVGQMVAKYVTHQMQMLRDKVSEQIHFLTSRKGLWMLIRHRLLGINTVDTLISTASKAILEEVFIIQRESGLLMASAALRPTVDRDVVAGMLTAIKAFVEDAFGQESEELEQVQYGTYRIVVQNFHSYYAAFALKGSLSAEETSALRDEILKFVQNTPELQQAINNSSIEQAISEKLKTTFFNTSHLLHIKF